MSAIKPVIETIIYYEAFANPYYEDEVEYRSNKYTKLTKKDIYNHYLQLKSSFKEINAEVIFNEVIEYRLVNPENKRTLNRIKGDGFKCYAY